MQGSQRGKGTYSRGQGNAKQEDAQGNIAGCSGTWTSLERLLRITEPWKKHEAGSRVEGTGGRVSAGFFLVPISPCSNFISVKLFCTSCLLLLSYCEQKIQIAELLRTTSKTMPAWLIEIGFRCRNIYTKRKSYDEPSCAHHPT